MEHTPEPWDIQIVEPRFDLLQNTGEVRLQAPFKVNGEGIPGKHYNVATLKFVSMKRYLYSIMRDEAIANARRIVACVSACKDISTDSLERNSVKQIATLMALSLLKEE